MKKSRKTLKVYCLNNNRTNNFCLISFPSTSLTIAFIQKQRPIKMTSVINNCFDDFWHEHFVMSCGFDGIASNKKHLGWC